MTFLFLFACIANVVVEEDPLEPATEEVPEPPVEELPPGPLHVFRHSLRLTTSGWMQLQERYVVRPMRTDVLTEPLETPYLATTRSIAGIERSELEDGDYDEISWSADYEEDGSRVYRSNFFRFNTVSHNVYTFNQDHQKMGYISHYPGDSVPDTIASYTYDSEKRLLLFRTEDVLEEGVSGYEQHYSYIDDNVEFAECVIEALEGTPADRFLPPGRWAGYVHDEQGRWIEYRREDQDGELIWAEYRQFDDAGNLVRFEVSSGEVRLYSYDEQGRLIQDRVENGGEGYTYIYGEGPNPIQRTIGNETIDWTYDEEGRMLSERRCRSSDPDCDPPKTWARTFDDEGRMMSETTTLGTGEVFSVLELEDLGPLEGFDLASIDPDPVPFEPPFE